MDQKVIKVILFIVSGAVGLIILSSIVNDNGDNPLNKLKAKYSATFEQCVGVIGTVNYEFFTHPKDKNISVIDVTMEKKGYKYSPFKLQYLYNKSTKILSEAPSAYAIEGEWVSKIEGMLSMEVFCM